MTLSVDWMPHTLNEMIYDDKLVNNDIDHPGPWSLWSSYSSCSVTCGTGQKSRSRGCTLPPPMDVAFEGLCLSQAGKMEASENETADCFLQYCGKYNWLEFNLWKSIFWGGENTSVGLHLRVVNWQTLGVVSWSIAQVVCWPSLFSVWWTGLQKREERINQLFCLVTPS